MSVQSTVDSESASITVDTDEAEYEFPFEILDGRAIFIPPDEDDEGFRLTEQHITVEVIEYIEEVWEVRPPSINHVPADPDLAPRFKSKAIFR